MTTYTDYYQGVKVSSNIPLNSGQAGNYDVKIYWSNNALGWIESKVSEGFSALNNYSGQITTKIIEQFENQFGPDHISNLTFNANNQYAELTFTLGSPTIFDFIGIFIFVVVWALAIATALIPGLDAMSIGAAIVYTFLDYIGVSTLDWFISNIDVIKTDITNIFGQGLGTLIEVILAGAIVIGLFILGVMVYNKTTPKKDEKEKEENWNKIKEKVKGKANEAKEYIKSKTNEMKEKIGKAVKKG